MGPASSTRRHTLGKANIPHKANHPTMEEGEGGMGSLTTTKAPLCRAIHRTSPHTTTIATRRGTIQINNIPQTLASKMAPIEEVVAFVGIISMVQIDGYQGLGRAPPLEHKAAAAGVLHRHSSQI